VDVPIEQHDINAIYAAELKVLGTKAPKEIKVIAEDQKQEDYYKNFRTNVSRFLAQYIYRANEQVLLAWTMSNGVLAIVIL
jgi:chitin synthase